MAADMYSTPVLLYKIFCMEFKFVLAVRQEEKERICEPGGRKFGMEVNLVLFQFYEAAKLNSFRKFLLFIVSWANCKRKKFLQAKNFSMRRTKRSKTRRDDRKVCKRGGRKFGIN